MIEKTNKIPLHLGIIIDGNRRWAKERGLPIFKGHLRGLDNVKKIGDRAFKRGVKIVTIFAFSSENWSRSKLEVKYLMQLFANVLSKKEIQEVHRKNIRLKVIGQKEKLSKVIQKRIREAEELTKNNKGGIMNLAISYGGRAEILQAIRNIIKKRIPPAKVTEEIINQNLWTGAEPYPDFIIRTGGELRLSNFLIWQAAYAELYFSPKYWPDFTEKDLDLAFENFALRKRNFGK